MFKTIFRSIGLAFSRLNTFTGRRLVGNTLVLMGVAIGLSYLGLSPLSAFFWLLLLGADFLFDMALIAYLKFRSRKTHSSSECSHDYSEDDEDDEDTEE